MMYNKNVTLHYHRNAPEGGLGGSRTATVASFAGTTASVFAALVLLLVTIDFYPEPRGAEATAAPAAAVAVEPEPAALVVDDTTPVRVIIDAIGVDVQVLSPESTDIATLDAALLRGAVHYPGSALLDERENMLLFGHSSYLPVVKNQAFKAFNGLSKLEKGNVVKVRSEGYEHLYRVTKVSMVSAEAATVNFATGRKMLTLVTCNTFGDKSDRYMVEAEFVGSYPIPE